VTCVVAAPRAADRLLLAAVRCWCFVRYPRVIQRTWRRGRVLPDPATPRSDVDKFLWRKLFDRNPLFVIACDKLAAKRYALSTCPELKTAAVLWTGDDPARIPADVLAGDVVVKANNGSGRNILIRGGQLDRTALNARAARWMRRLHGYSFGEWAYREATRCLLVEEMLLEHGKPVATEYKFHVAGGRTAYVFVMAKSDGGDIHFHIDRDGHTSPPEVVLPANFARMLHIAETLGAPFDYVRCDLYELDGVIYFSELTVYPLSGQGGTNSRLRDLRNAAWDLRKSWFLTTPQRGWRKRYAAALRRWLDAQPG
jgi:hypothetical protein